MPKIWKIVVTGGPCGGKSTLLSIAAQKLAPQLSVYVAEESATTLIREGIQLKEAMRSGDLRKIAAYQREIMQHTHENTSRLVRFAEIEGRDAVILCDRGLPDSRAYLPEGKEGDEIYLRLLQEVARFDEIAALDYYDGVIKMTTAANGAADFYTLDNNLARDETLDLAVYLDRRIEKAYTGQSHLRPINNFVSGRGGGPISFEDKVTRALNEIRHLLGVPPIEIERKFVIGPPRFSELPFYRTVDIEQMYLPVSDEGETVRIRRRTLDDASTYYLNRKKHVGLGSRIEIERRINAGEYELLCELRDKQRGIIRKKRSHFLFEGQSFELDSFLNPSGKYVLEVELSDIGQHIDFPPFIDVIKEVTEDEAYSNYALALEAVA